MSMPLVDTAGLDVQVRPSLRRSAIAEVRRVLRKQDATDTEVEEALEALVELAKD